METAVDITAGSDDDASVMEYTIRLLTQEIVSSCLSIIFFIASLFFPRPVYVCLSRLISVNNQVAGFEKRESDDRRRYFFCVNGLV